MKVTCQVVTTPTVDSPGSALILGLESKRYLFGNVSEGIQRALLQRKIRTARIGDFFLTGKTEWKSVGGLLGMMLTLADQETARKTDFENKRTETIARNETIQVYGKGTMGTVQENFEKKVLNVHGGENLLHTLGTTRAFVFRTSMRTNVQEIEADYKDEHLRCHPIKVFPEGYVPGEVDEKEDLEALVINRGGGGGPAGLGAGARKRSFDGELKKPLTKQQVLQSVVSDMFNSSWTMDTMVDAEIPGDDPADPNGAGNGSGVLPKQVRAPWPASHVQSLPRSRPSQASLSYYVTLHPQRGRFLPNIAKALGVKPGPEFRKLTNGESVTTAEGKIVKPEECMEPQKPGKHILVLDIPDVTYIQPLLSREELQEENLEATIFWLLGDGVSADTRVWTKIRKWGNATHVLSSPDLCPNTITIQGAAKAATRLALLHPDHFPIPRHNNTPAQLLPSDIPNLLLARPSQEISILPKFDVRQIQIPMTHPDGSFDFDAARKDIRPEYLRLAEEARETVIREEREEGLEELPGKDVEIITLGTGSAMPSKYRNVSATLLRIPNVGSILFDCGEGTLGQLSRLYEHDELQVVLRDLKCIYISHMHADHHLGTTAVLKAWYKAKHNSTPCPIPDIAMPDSPSPTSPYKPRTRNPPPVPDNIDGVMWIVAQAKYGSLLHELSLIEDFGFSWTRTLTTEDLRTKHNTYRTLHYRYPLYEVLSLKSILTAPANHCLGASTTAWEWKDGFKFAYSGDTRPTREFVEIGKGATLLLHEATFDDELGAEARGKRHCTTSEALGAGKEMGARTVVLTHFSQRYPKLPVINGGGEEGEKGGGMEVALAFDGMRMRVGEIGRFRNFVPALRELYEERDEEEVVGGDGDGDGEAEADAAEMGEKVGRNAGKVGKKEKEVAPSKRQEKKEGNKERKENVRRERREKAQGQVGQAHQHQHQQGGCCAEPQKEEVVVVATESEDVVPAPETEQIQPAKTPLRKKALPGYF